MKEERLSIRVRPSNPDHHLWLNNGTWFAHYTLHRADYTKRRVRVSLGTRDLETARRNRDCLLAQYQEPRRRRPAERQAA